MTNPQMKTSPEYNQKIIIWVLAGVMFFNVFAFMGYKLLVSKITDAVIQKLQKDYSPSPYGPGIDPDRVSPDSFIEPVYFKTHRGEPSKAFLGKHNETWLSDWEKSRGANGANP